MISKIEDPKLKEEVKQIFQDGLLALAAISESLKLKQEAILDLINP